MLSFNIIGNLGRLGNQMFQYAALKGIASYHGYEFVIPPECEGAVIYDVFSIQKTNNTQLTNNPSIGDGTHSFNDELFRNCPDDVDLYGYFQTHKYFQHIEDEIRKDFSFRSEVIKDCYAFLIKNFNNCEFISLHVRRGDYVGNSCHPVQTVEYYQQALEKMPENIPVIIFSDEPDWCSSQEFFNSDRFLISKNNSTEVDLCLMSLANYHIIANSSFSWWGAWLAKSKKTIAPKYWFSGGISFKSVHDMAFDGFEFL